MSPLRIILFALPLLLSTVASAQTQQQPKPVPRAQVLPLPRDEASMQIDGREITRYYFDKAQERPFLYPIVGPAGRSLTRMGHPRDPVGHSHHNSVWISHNDVDGVDFWSDRRHGIIEHQRVARFEDSDDAASILAINHWKVTGTGKDKDDKPHTPRTLLIERRLITLQPLEKGESLIVIDLQYHPAGKEAVTFQESAFGLLGVRMAKPLGVLDGGGVIRNSQGNVGEQGDNGCFRKPARWCDYSGRIVNAPPGAPADAGIEGITLLDHPSNHSHPTPFHVRGDGWMGACLSFKGAVKVEPEKPLRLRYGLYIHRGAPKADAIEERWKTFAKGTIEPLPEK